MTLVEVLSSGPLPYGGCMCVWSLVPQAAVQLLTPLPPPHTYAHTHTRTHTLWSNPLLPRSMLLLRSRSCAAAKWLSCWWISSLRRRENVYPRLIASCMKSSSKLTPIPQISDGSTRTTLDMTNVVTIKNTLSFFFQQARLVLFTNMSFKRIHLLDEQMEVNEFLK